MPQLKSLFFLATFSAAFIDSISVWQAWAANDRVQFPEGYENGVHYATVNRGGVSKEIFTSPQAIAAAKAGQPLPDGTVIMMEDHRGGALHRYVVMEKRAGWGDAYPESVRAGDWEFREFAPTQSPNLGENGQRCMSCHQSQAGQDFVFTLDRMRNAD
ncbi:hypothetical protein C241_16808 [Bradyrhizobium lupini HPC(L)]|uniref:Cytochrome P460 domain-containing protein n=1 Tax=Bradyrhizobium lupini HPC(L) TaxID=1229491 RepID=A0ABP2RPN2_RHILU|nr:hypothetical protein C241_16808 [Bradyrhizobium lupini HPC(L)]